MTPKGKTKRATARRDAEWLPQLDGFVQVAQEGLNRLHHPIATLTDDHRQTLAKMLGIGDLDPRAAKILDDAIASSVRSLVVFFSVSASSASLSCHEAQQAEFERLAADPARALLAKPRDAGAEGAHAVVSAVAEFNEIDASTCAGAAAVGDIAEIMIDQKKPRSDAGFTMGEAQLFDDIVAAISELMPDALTALPANDGAEYAPCPALDFAIEYVIQVADRARAPFHSSETRVHDRIDALKKKSPRTLLQGLREPRNRYRESP